MFDQKPGEGKVNYIEEISGTVKKCFIVCTAIIISLSDSSQNRFYRSA